MAFTRVPDPNLDPDKPGRSADIKQIRDNQDDHESRLVAVEDANIRIFSHFARFENDQDSAGGAYTADLAAHRVASGHVNYQGSDFHLYSAGAMTQILSSGTADNHYIAWSGAAGVASCIANLNFNFTTRTKPITFNWRFRTNDITNALYVGLTVLPATNANTVPTDGIYLFLGVAANTWRFRSTSSVSGLSTTGADIAVVNSTWYEVKIVFTNSPGNRALCYLNGVLKETFTTDLPTTINLCGRMTQAMGGAGDTIDLDRALVSAAGTLSDSP